MRLQGAVENLRSKRPDEHSAGGLGNRREFPGNVGRIRAKGWRYAARRINCRHAVGKRPCGEGPTYSRRKGVEPAQRSYWETALGTQLQMCPGAGRRRTRACGNFI